MPTSGRALVLAIVAIAVPGVLALGWWLGRIEGPPPAAGAADDVARERAAAIARVHPARVGVRYGEAPAAAPEAPAAPGTKRAEVVSAWTSYASAIETSRANGKPVMLDFNAEWCGPCQALKRSVFDDATRGHAVQAAVIPVSIVDQVRERGENPADIEDLQRRYSVDAFPTVVVFSPATGRSVSRRGFGDADDMVRWIEDAARSVQ